MAKKTSLQTQNSIVWVKVDHMFSTHELMLIYYEKKKNLYVSFY